MNDKTAVSVSDPKLDNDKQDERSSVPKSLAYADEKKELELIEKAQDIELKKEYSKKCFRFICIWCSLVLLIIFLTGFGCLKLHYSVLITLLGSTTANVIFIMQIIIKALFVKNN